MPDTLPDGALPPCPQPFNLAAYVLEAGLACPDKIALTTIRAETHEDWTHARLRRTVLGAATGFLGIGLRPGDRVLLRTANPGGFAVSFLGALASLRRVVDPPLTVQHKGEVTRWQRRRAAGDEHGQASVD